MERQQLSPSFDQAMFQFYSSSVPKTVERALIMQRNGADVHDINKGQHHGDDWEGRA